jgi:hypothetical protein
MESSCRSLIPFLPLLCSWKFRRLYSIQFQAHILAGWRPKLDSSLHSGLLSTCLERFCTDHAEKSLYCWGVFTDPLPSMDVLLLPALAPAGICLPSRCLAMVLYVTILYSSSLLTKSWISLKSMHIWRATSFNPIISPVCDECKKSDQLLISDVKLHSADPSNFAYLWT